MSGAVGSFAGGYSLRRVGPGAYHYVPDPGDPLTFFRPNGQAVVVAELFGTTDLASIPRALWWIPGFAPADLERPSIVHDALYLDHKAGKERFGFEESNLILAEAMIAEGLPRWRARLFRWGCDRFGRRVWDRMDAPPVPVVTFGPDAADPGAWMPPATSSVVFPAGAARRPWRIMPGPVTAAAVPWTMFGPPTVELVGRSPRWPRLAKDWLQRFPECAACDRTEGCVPHHVKPYHRFPELELETINLLTLCPRCHLCVGHGGNWRDWNENCVEAAALCRAGRRVSGPAVA